MHIPRQAATEVPPGPPTAVVPVTVGPTPTGQSTPDSSHSSLNSVAIVIPIVVAVIVLIAALYLYFKRRRPDLWTFKPLLPTATPARSTRTAGSSTATLVSPPSTEVERERRREIREQRRLAALRRTESGRSVATLPRYKTDPDDEEQILLKEIDTDAVSLAPTYDDSPWPEHPPTWSEIHGHSGQVASPTELTPTSPTRGPPSPSATRPRRSVRSAPGSGHSHASHADSTHSAPVYAPSPRRPDSPGSQKSPEKPKPIRSRSADSSTWSISTSDDEDDTNGYEGNEAHTSRAWRIIGESSAKILGNTSLRRHLQRNASFRLSPANSRMSSIRSVFTARTHQSSMHQAGGESTNALLPAQEEEVLFDARSARSGRSRAGSESAPPMTRSRSSSDVSLGGSILGVVGVMTPPPAMVERSEGERSAAIGRSVSLGVRTKKLERKATA